MDRPNDWSNDQWLPPGPNNETEDTFLWYDTWVVVYENSTDGGEEVLFKPRRIGVIVFGAVLAVWILLSSGILGATVTRARHRYERIRPVNWLIFNFALAQFLMGAFVVPLNVKTERDGHWGLGGCLCRSWLLIQIVLASLTMWSALMITIDRFVYVINPEMYGRRMTRKCIAVLIFLSWIVSLSAAVPPGISMARDPDFVLEEVCAMHMSKQYAFGISFTAFFSPGVMLLVGTVAILAVAIQTRGQTPKQCAIQDSQMLYQAAKTTHDDSSITYLDQQTIGNLATTIMAVNMSCVMLWAPFYVLNVMVPFCNGMCVDPGVWSLCVWLGYSSAGVCPILWFLDREIRQLYKVLIQCSRKDVVYYDATTTSTAKTDKKWNFVKDQEAKIFKPYLYLK